MPTHCTRRICDVKGCQGDCEDKEKTDAAAISPIDIAVRALNDAFAADPAAIHSLLCNRVPCNQALADHPSVPVTTLPMLKAPNPQYAITALGLINGVIGPLTGKRVMTVWDDTDPANPVLQGFDVYTGHVEDAYGRVPLPVPVVILLRARSAHVFERICELTAEELAAGAVRGKEADVIMWMQEPTEEQTQEVQPVLRTASRKVEVFPSGVVRVYDGDLLTFHQYPQA